MNRPAPSLLLGLPAWRSRILMMMLLTGFSVMLARAVYLQGLNNQFLQQKGESRYGRVIVLSATPGRLKTKSVTVLPVMSMGSSPS